jgi:hypothetical protein
MLRDRLWRRPPARPRGGAPDLAGGSSGSLGGSPRPDALDVPSECAFTRLGATTSAHDREYPLPGALVHPASTCPSGGFYTRSAHHGRRGAADPRATSTRGRGRASSCGFTAASRPRFGSSSSTEVHFYCAGRLQQGLPYPYGPSSTRPALAELWRVLEGVQCAQARHCGLIPLRATIKGPDTTYYEVAGQRGCGSGWPCAVGI